MYRTTDPEIRDAYAYTAQAVRAEQARNDWLADRERELQRLMLRPLSARIAPNWAYCVSGDDLPIGEDFAAWLAMQDHRDVALAVFSAIDRTRLVEAYCAARARADATVRERDVSWHDEAYETLLWERAGGF
jgi:hypothetical protein